ncbi:MAG TPA: hypothetical protein VE913_16425 [Longimicrobium sp.]|nr:hypothetical protein [Longimicrobium sp.]
MIVSLAVEGISDVAVLRRVCAEAGLQVGAEYVANGKARLDAKLAGYNQAAHFAPWLVVRDLDHDAVCAPSLVNSLLPAPAPRMLLRVAVRSIESWLLADRGNFADYFGVAVSRVPTDPEALDRPKRTIVDLARGSRKRSIREGVVPGARISVEVGPEYTARIIEFATLRWNPTLASDLSPSLARCLAALRNRFA